MNVSFNRGESKNNNLNLKNTINSNNILSISSIIRNLLKADFSKLIQPILSGTTLSNMQITDSLINDIDLTFFINNKSKESNIILIKLINAALYRTALESSLITGKDYTSYLNDIKDEVTEMCNDIINLIN